MKLFPLIAALLLSITLAYIQGTKVFDPRADAMSDVKNAIAQALKTDKHVLVKIGYNQCPWCIKLHHLFKEDVEIDSLLKADYVLVKVNYSKENYNQEIMTQLEFPQRFGFPVLVVLDATGKRLQTQNTLYLEKEKSYDRKRIISFLKSWNRKAIDPASYTMR